MQDGTASKKPTNYSEVHGRRWTCLHRLALTMQAANPPAIKSALGVYRQPGVQPERVLRERTPDEKAREKPAPPWESVKPETSPT